MKVVVTFQIVDDFAEQISYHSVVCDENEVADVQQRLFNQFAPFIEVESIVPYIEDNDDENILDDEDIPF